MTTGEPTKNDATKAVYEQLCHSYRAIDDFRSKLLTALPIASAGAALALADKLAKKDILETTGPFLIAIGCFSAAVTLALLCYEIYGIRKCGALIDAGKSLEQGLGVAGQFTSRPPDYINEPLAASIIYPAVVAGWSYVALYGSKVARAPWIAAAIFFAGFVPMLIWDITLVYRDRHAGQQGTRPQASVMPT
jgi:hypothetical protein